MSMKSETDFVITSRLSKTKSIVGIIEAVAICCIAFFLLYYLFAGNKYIKMVKTGHPYKYPDITYEEAFGEYFDSPKWSYDSSTDDKIIVFSGNANVNGKTSCFEYRFKLNSENGSFELQSLEIDGNQQGGIIAIAWNDAPFSEYEK